MPPIVQLRSRVDNADALRGKMLTSEDVTLKLEGDADVYKPDGTLLCALRRGAIPASLRSDAYPALHELRKYKTDNRGAYAGATRTHAVFDDGTLSKNSRTRTAEGKRLMVASAIIGYYDRQGGRFPFCRETMFTAKHVTEWTTIIPMVEHVGQVFKQTIPKRYAIQMARAKEVPKDYMIGNTPYTTLTVNNNVAPAATHKDAGDFKEGFGAIAVLRRGHYTGGWLVFPEYRVGVDLQDGDVFFFNSHEFHGVTPMMKDTEDAERISVVFYMRERMNECLPLKEELARAQSRGEISKNDEAT